MNGKVDTAALFALRELEGSNVALHYLNPAGRFDPPQALRQANRISSRDDDAHVSAGSAAGVTDRLQHVSAHESRRAGKQQPRAVQLGPERASALERRVEILLENPRQRNSLYQAIVRSRPSSSVKFGDHPSVFFAFAALSH